MPLTPVSCAISDASMSWGSPVSVLKLEQSVFTWKLWAKRCGAVMGRAACPGGEAGLCAHRDVQSSLCLFLMVLLLVTIKEEPQCC